MAGYNSGSSNTANLYIGNKLGIRTTSPSEALEIGSTDTTNGTGRIKLSTYEDTDAFGRSEVIRIQSMDNDAKGCIAYQDSTGTSMVWLQMHDYLHYYSTYNFATTDVSTSADTITIASSGYVTGFAVVITSSGTTPGGITSGNTYYVRVSGSTLTLYDTSAHASAGGATGKIDITSTGSGVHTITPTNTYNNNRHKHFSIEVADSTNAKQTRFSIPYGYDTTEIGTFSANFNVNDGTARINASSGLTGQLQFGNALSDNLAPDGTSIRWSLKKDATSESGSNVGSDFSLVRFNDSGVAQDSPIFVKRSTGFVGFGTSSNFNGQINVAGTIGVQRANTSAFASYLLDTNGTTQWTIGMRNDTTQDFHFRDSVNSRTPFKIVQSTAQVITGVSTTIASSASATWDGINHPAVTVTISGSTNITTATGFNYVSIGQPTLSNASITITTAASLYIGNAPVASGGDSITNKYSLFVDAGLCRFDGDGTNIWELPADATAGVDATIDGRIPILVGGATKYIRYYAD